MRSWILIGVLALSLGGFAAVGVLAGPNGSGDTPSPTATVEEPTDDGADALSPPAEIDDGEDDGGDALSPPAEIDDGEDDANDDNQQDDGAHGVPDGSPACDNHEDTDGNGDGCGTVTNCGGQELHLPQPAVDNQNGNHCDDDNGAVDDANDNDADEAEHDANDGEHDANDDGSGDGGDSAGGDHGQNHGPDNSHGEDD